MFGPEIIANTLSGSNVEDANGNWWQYHPRSDHHSKLCCWALMFDLMVTCDLLLSQIKSGKVKFGINHPINDQFRDRKKKAQNKRKKYVNIVNKKYTTGNNTAPISPKLLIKNCPGINQPNLEVLAPSISGYIPSNLSIYINAAH